MTDLSQIEWRWDKKYKEYVAFAYGKEIAVRRTEGRYYSAHYGPDRYRFDGYNVAYSTVARAKASAERYLADVLTHNRWPPAADTRTTEKPDISLRDGNGQVVAMFDTRIMEKTNGR